MSVLSINKFLLPFLLLLVPTLECRGESQGSLHKDASLVSAMKGVSSALGCFGGSLKDGLRSLSNQALQMKEQINKLNSNLESKQDTEDTGRVDTLAEEIAELKKKLASKDGTILSLKEDVRVTAEVKGNHSEKVKHLTQVNEDLKTNLAEKDKQILSLKDEVEEKGKEIDNNLEEVKDVTQANEHLKKNLTEEDEQVKKLTEGNEDLKKKFEEKDKQVQNLNITLTESQHRVPELQQELNKCHDEIEEVLGPVDWTKECRHRQLWKIKEVVQAFVTNKNWDALKTGLESVLNSSSLVYSQLSAGSVYNVGYNGYTQLASLLLCGGMPVDTLSSDGDSMMNGAVRGSHLELSKLLVGRGAGVNVRGHAGWTTLIWAAYSPLEIVQLLVNAGADTAAKDDNGETALSWARAGSNTAVVQYLSGLPH